MLAHILTASNIRRSRYTLYLVRPQEIRNPEQFSVAAWPAAVVLLKFQAYLGRVM